MRSHEGGHTQAQTVLPEPLSADSVWTRATFALPAAQLSVTSFAVLVTVFAFLQVGREHALFVLPATATFAIAAFAAALAWSIVLRCRHRPGRRAPRMWALFLAGFTSTVALLALLCRMSPIVLAFAVAGLTAALTLAPRLIKVQPDNAMAQRIAPLSLLAALIILPAACAVRHAVAQQTSRRVNDRIEQIRAWSAAIKEVTDHDWSQLEDHSDSAATEIETLKALDFRGEAQDIELWRSASLLGRDEELSAAMQQLTDQIVAGFDLERAPRVSILKEPALRWDVSERRWQSYARFAGLSEITGAYYHELGRLYTELGPASNMSENEQESRYAQHYAVDGQLLQRHLNEFSATWTDNWVVQEVPGHDGQLIAIRDLLASPFAQTDDGAFAAGDLLRLSSVSLSAMRQLARRARGCHLQSYEEHGQEYSRLDCYAYAPAQHGTGAELRAELRLVYWNSPRRASRQQAPSEIYFHFVVPEGENGDRYVDVVMTGLAAAAQQSAPSAVIRRNGRSGSVASGFTLRDGSSGVRVFHPAVVTLVGLNSPRSAVVVRATSLREN